MDAPQAVELSQADINSIQNSVGGEAAYQQLVGWAAQNFSEAEIQAFDNVVDSGNVAAINLALAGLQARYTDANGYEGKMIQGKAATPADTFKSQAEVVRAMSDARYDRDPAYRDEIMQKLARSDLKF
jgi:high-affinity Fe2+/Pb2+ permease